MPDITVIILPLLLITVAVLLTVLYLFGRKVLLVTASNTRFKGVFEAIWEIEKAVLETTDFDEATKRVVNIILTQLGYINYGYEIIVLSLLDIKKWELRRIAISQTQAAERFLKAVPIPFENIVIPLTATKNLSVKAIVERKMYITESVSDVLYPALSKEWVESFQKKLGIKASIVFPILAKDKVLGSLIFSLSKEKEKIKEQEWSVLHSFVGAVGIALDNALLFKSLNVTTKKLEAANVKLKEIDKLKDEFVSLASHELRTPMTIIKSYLWMILEREKSSLNEKQKTYLDRAYASTERLINLVNDMLNVSRIESGRLTLNIKPIDLIELANSVYQEMLPKAQELGISLDLQKPIEPLPRIQADPERIEQVFINLIGNSLKFTPSDGKITITLSYKDNMATVAISDTGKGIAGTDMDKLFKKFGMVGNDYLTKTSTQGTGLGLYLSKAIVELHGGKIWVESKGEGKGSKFSFTLKTA